MEFNQKKFIQNTYRELQKYVKDRILITASGGVDSSTSTALIKKSGLKCELVFIDTGFLRDGETEFIKSIFKEKVTVINAKHLFVSSLGFKSTPEDKRESFRKIYFQIIKNYVIKNGFTGIAQGTQFHKTSTKRYHNSPTNEFLRLGIKVIEPVRGLTKEQIRLIARELKLPEEIINRRPFPGPGLLIRFSGKCTRHKIDLIRKITHIVDEFIDQNKMDFEKCYQMFPYLTDEYVPYVNKHDVGSIGPIILIRAVSCDYSKNGAIYKPFILPSALQEKLVGKIMDGGIISRVCFDSTTKNGSGSKVKHGATIEYA